MSLPQSNARLLSIVPPNNAEDYDSPGTAGTPKWSGDTDAYITESVIQSTSQGRLDRYKRTSIVIPGDLRPAVDLATGDVVTYSYAGVMFARKVVDFRAAVLPTVRTFSTVKVELEDKAEIVVQPPTGNEIAGLSRVAWEGGPDYWSQFAKADARGWSSPTFFPIAVWFPQNDAPRVQSLLNLGVNTAMGLEHTGSDAHPTTDLGMHVMAQHSIPTLSGHSQWTPGQIGSDPGVVGWFTMDEPDQGYGGFVGTDDQFGYLAALAQMVAQLRAYNDGRFLWSNFGNGIVGTFWAPDTLDDMYSLVDGASVDKYCYTSPSVRTLFAGIPGFRDKAPSWPGDNLDDGDVKTSAAYGWMAKRLATVYGNNAKPAWIFVETKRPWLFNNDFSDVEAGSTAISYDQLEGAVWSGIANEARGIAYFSQNNTGPSVTGQPYECSGSYSLLDCEQDLRDRVTLVHGQVAALAPVLNTQSFAWNFGAAGIDTMLKAKSGFAYVFASVGVNAALGAKTFTLPGAVTGTTVEVLNESRTIPVTDGQFTDTFAAEYSHHTYKVAI